MHKILSGPVKDAVKDAVNEAYQAAKDSAAATSPLANAAKMYNYPEFKRLINDGALVAIDKDLADAIKTNDQKKIEAALRSRIISFNCDTREALNYELTFVDPKDKVVYHGETPLALAARLNLSEVCKYFIFRGAFVCPETPTLSPIECAARWASTKTLKYLIETYGDQAFGWDPVSQKQRKPFVGELAIFGQENIDTKQITYREKHIREYPIENDGTGASGTDAVSQAKLEYERLNTINFLIEKGCINPYDWRDWFTKNHLSLKAFKCFEKLMQNRKTPLNYEQQVQYQHNDIIYELPFLYALVLMHCDKTREYYENPNSTIILYLLREKQLDPSVKIDCKSQYLSAIDFLIANIITTKQEEIDSLIAHIMANTTSNPQLVLPRWFIIDIIDSILTVRPELLNYVSATYNCTLEDVLMSKGSTFQTVVDSARNRINNPAPVPQIARGMVPTISTAIEVQKVASSESAPVIVGSAVAPAAAPAVIPAAASTVAPAAASVVAPAAASVVASAAASVVASAAASVVAPAVASVVAPAAASGRHAASVFAGRTTRSKARKDEGDGVAQPNPAASKRRR